LTGGTSALEILHFLQQQYRYQDHIVSNTSKTVCRIWSQHVINTWPLADLAFCLLYWSASRGWFISPSSTCHTLKMCYIRSLTISSGRQWCELSSKPLAPVFCESLVWLADHRSPTEEA
jgi:hypothetical protein